MVKNIIEGQISFWDIKITKPKEKITEKPISFTKTKEKVTENTDSFTLLEKYKTIENLSRIIKYCGGGYGIELQEGMEFKTIYLNKEGKEEFQFNKKSPVLPMDKILICNGQVSSNKLQEERLQSVKSKYPMAKIIKRKGDENIILALENKVISVNRKGWVLEFSNVQAVYSLDEVVREEIDLKDMQWSAKAGDIIETTYGKEVIAAEVYRIYNSGYTLSIIWDKKHTAIPRCAIRKILKQGSEKHYESNDYAMC